MKTFALVIGVLVLGALCAVFAGADSDYYTDEDSSSGSHEQPLKFPPYPVFPERVLKVLSEEDSSTDEEDSGSGPGQGRTIFLLLRLYQLLNRLNLTSSG